MRFEQISKVLNKSVFTVNDIGCGYGKFVDYLDSIFESYSYFGYDLSEEMVSNARNIYPTRAFKKIDSLDDIVISDFCVASGIFSVKMEASNDEWLKFILETIKKMDEKSINGFSFNMLTKYSDEELMRPNLILCGSIIYF